MSSTNRNRADRGRVDQDFYATPPEATEALIRYFGRSMFTPTLDPCCGDGAILKAARGLGVEMRGIELDHGRGYDAFLDFEVEVGVDALTRPWTGEVVLTNPPFVLAQEFIEKAIRECRACAFLERMDFFGSIKRLDFWRRNRPGYVLQLIPRPQFMWGKSDSCEYAWIVWFSWLPRSEAIVFDWLNWREDMRQCR